MRFLCFFCVQKCGYFQQYSPVRLGPPRRNSCLNTLSERGCVSENQSSANERRSPPTPWHLFTTEAGRRLVERWGKSGFTLRSGAPKTVGKLGSRVESAVGSVFLSGKQLENLALLHRTPTSICKLVKRNKFLSCGFIKINYFHLLTLFTLPYSPNLFKIKQDKLESKGIQYTI